MSRVYEIYRNAKMPANPYDYKTTLALEYEAEKTRSLNQVTFAINANITASGDMLCT